MKMQTIGAWVRAVRTRITDHRWWVRQAVKSSIWVIGAFVVALMLYWGGWLAAIGWAFPTTAAAERMIHHLGLD